MCVHLCMYVVCMYVYVYIFLIVLLEWLSQYQLPWLWCDKWTKGGKIGWSTPNHTELRSLRKQFHFSFPVDLREIGGVMILWLALWFVPHRLMCIGTFWSASGTIWGAYGTTRRQCKKWALLGGGVCSWWLQLRIFLRESWFPLAAKL